MENLVGSAVSLNKPLRADKEEFLRIQAQYNLLTRLITQEHGTRQLLLATEVYRYYQQTGIYDMVRKELIALLRHLNLGDRIKQMMREKDEPYEKLLRQQFVGLTGQERLVPLKTIQLYCNSKPDRATAFDGALTTRDKALFSELAL